MKNSVGDLLKLFFSIGIGVLIVWLTTRKLTAEQINSVKNVFSEAKYFWVILGPLVGMPVSYTHLDVYKRQFHMLVNMRFN